MFRSATLTILTLLAPPQAPAPMPDTFQPPAGWRKLGDSIWFDAAEKTLVVRARVVLREGFLEHLLCKNQSKEHESILATAAPPQLIHAGLLLTGAEPGKPVTFQPEYAPPSGTPVSIRLQWDRDGKPQEADAREWVVDPQSKKNLEPNWVFAGSLEIVDEARKKRYYAADQGDLITVANFPEAILDVPIASSADDAARSFMADTPKIPPLGTWVSMRLRPLEP